VRILQQQTADAKKRLAEERPRDPARDLIVARRRGPFPGNLPQGAADEGVEQGLPVIETAGAREAVIDGALIRMAELVDLVGIIFHDPAAAQVALDGSGVGFVVAAEHRAVEEVQQSVEGHDLQRGNQVALAQRDRINALGRSGLRHTSA
jgi:hypothetical protein